MTLFIISLILFSIVAMPSITLACVHYKRLNTYFGDTAYCIDVLGNVVGQYLWNFLFLNGITGYTFGLRGNTISMTLAENYYNCRTNLTGFGLWMCNFLIKRGDTAFTR